MYGTSLGGIEQLMMLAPNFPQRRSGIVINNHFNCEEITALNKIVTGF